MPRTTTFSVTRDDLIKAALRKLKVIGEGETPSTEDYTNCAFALNLMIKAWAKDNIYLWKVTDITVALVDGNVSYQIGPTATGTGAVVTHRPMRILEGSYVRDTDNNDTVVTIIAQQDYYSLANKTSEADKPSQIYYAPLLDNGVIYVYPVPDNSDNDLHVLAQLQVYDFSSGSETLDFPQECYQAIVYGLADELMDEYTRPDAITAQRITGKAQLFRDQLADMATEDVSVFFQPYRR